MDKVKLGTIVVEKKVIEHNGVSFEVESFLNFSKQVFLINIYLDEYFKNPDENLIGMSDYAFLDAECKLLYQILKLNTNIDVDSIEDDVYVDAVFASKVAGAITNFKSFRDKLGFILAEIKEQKSLKASLGETISALVSKGYDMLDKLTEISPEGIEKARVTGLELVEKLKEVNLLGDYPGAVPAILPEPVVKVRKAKK